MLEDRFTILLQDLSSQLGIELKPDQNNSCLLNIKDKLKIQIELDPTDQASLILGSVLGELPPGKFREDVLFSTLKANARPYPRVGNFAYSTKLNSLILFETINIQHFTIDNILSILTPFIHKAFAWKDAINRADVSPHLVETDFTNMKDDNILD